MIPQLYTPEDAALRLNCTVDKLEIRWRAGDVERYQLGTSRRYALLEHPAAESNGAIRLRRPKSGSTGRGDRREYMRAYQRAWVAARRAEFFADKVCADCSSADDLQLDHRDPELKVSHRVWSWAQERRDAEIAKCDVRCSACHIMRHGAEPGGKHGGKWRYEAHGCRCDECVAGQRERRQARTARERERR